MGCSERKKEIRRRRHRKEKLDLFGRKIVKANTSEKQVIAQKLRRLTPGAEVLIARMALE